MGGGEVGDHEEPAGGAIFYGGVVGAETDEVDDFLGEAEGEEFGGGDGAVFEGVVEEAGEAGGGGGGEAFEFFADAEGVMGVGAVGEAFAGAGDAFFDEGGAEGLEGLIGDV